MNTAVLSDIGKVREINEDYAFLSETYSSGLSFAIVADGMGGYLAGEVASKTAVDTIKEALHRIINDKLSIGEYKQILEKAISDANEIVYNKSQNNSNYTGMGTTIVAAIISNEWIIYGHIGDSRAYLIDNKNINQLTVDHSLVNELLKNGQISEEEAINHPQKNIITRALGTDQTVFADINHTNWDKGNTIILCSDGLTNHVTNVMILEQVNKNSDINQIADNLLSLALEAGGEDNISLIVIRNE